MYKEDSNSRDFGYPWWPGVGSIHSFKTNFARYHTNSQCFLFYFLTRNIFTSNIMDRYVFLNNVAEML